MKLVTRAFASNVALAVLLCVLPAASAADLTPDSVVPDSPGALPMKKYFTRYLDPDRLHPYLLVSSAELRDTARRLFEDKEPLLLAAFDIVASDAEPDLDEISDHRGPEACRTLGAAYLAALYQAAGRASDAAPYAERARNALLAFSELGVPEHQEGTGFLSQNYLISLAFAYDLVWNLPEWTPAERDSLQTLFYGYMDELRHHMHRKHLSNHAAWCQARAASTAFLFKDEPLAAECLDGPDSYSVRLAHEFFDDGLNYEQSTWQYQVYSVMPVMLTALAAHGAGALPDPLTLEVDNDLSLVFLGGTTGDYTFPFYPADETDFPRPEKKNLQLAVTAQFDMLRPDMTCPSIGDYGGPTPSMADHWLAEFAWDFYSDERAARLLANGHRKADGLYILSDGVLTLAFGKPLPTYPRFPSTSFIYAQSGYAVLKSLEGDAFWGSDSIHAVLSYGPFGNGHGHADKLHLDIAGDAGKCCTEELHRDGVEWQYWNSTVSHNSVVVDGKSQPGDQDMFVTGINSCGRLVLSRFEPGFTVVAAEDPAVYDWLTTYRRTVAVTDTYLVDLFEVAAEKNSTFDWFLHGMGSLHLPGLSLDDASLGFDSRGYQFLQNARSAAVDSPFNAAFSIGHAVFFPLAANAEVFAATGPWRENARRPALIVRTKGAKAAFLAVHDPSGRAVLDVTAVPSASSGFAIDVRLENRLDRVEFRPKRPETGAYPYDVVYSKGTVE